MPTCNLCELTRIYRIRKQIEFYFGDLNYRHDTYLKSNEDSEHYVSIQLILTFNRMRLLHATREDVIKASENNWIVQLNKSKDRIRRIGGHSIKPMICNKPDVMREHGQPGEGQTDGTQLPDFSFYTPFPIQNMTSRNVDPW